MDYCTLNKFVVQDTYPLPLISNILDHLQGKTLFTKFNIHWGYNNIQIKEEDRWKATFKTPFRLYKPTVMYFGLTNSFFFFFDNVYSGAAQRTRPVTAHCCICKLDIGSPSLLS